MTNKTEDELIGRLDATPEPGSVWVHVKTGNRYLVVTCALRETDLEPVVVYHRRDERVAVVWCRPLTEWLEPVEAYGATHHRFRPVSPNVCPLCAHDQVVKVDHVLRCRRCGEKRG